MEPPTATMAICPAVSFGRRPRSSIGVGAEDIGQVYHRGRWSSVGVVGLGKETSLRFAYV